MPSLQVAVLDMNSFSFSFLTESLPNPSSRVISMTWKSFVYDGGNVKSPRGTGPKNLDKNLENLMFVSTKDAKLYVFDANNRMITSKPMQLKKDTTAISVHIIGKYGCYVILCYAIMGKLRDFI